MGRMMAVLALAVALAGPAVAQNAPGPVGTPEGQWRAQTYWIPMNDNGVPRLLYARLCRPLGEAPARVVVYAHGTPADVARRVSVGLPSCDSEAFRWFLQRGYAVLGSIRRGFGATGGSYAENGGGCDRSDFIKPGLESARDVAATVDYAATLPFLRPSGMVVVGLSTGGFATIAYDSVPHPRVTAFINFSGGRGGHRDNKPNNNCSPEALPVATARFGATAATPMLWIYQANDSFFNPELVGSMYAAFTRAGGQADYRANPAFGSDGHDMFVLNGGSAVWGPLVERYLATRPAQ
jgi:dienelactone hydrolase